MPCSPEVVAYIHHIQNDFCVDGNQAVSANLPCANAMQLESVYHANTCAQQYFVWMKIIPIHPSDVTWCLRIKA